MAKDYRLIGKNFDFDVDSESVMQLKCDPMFRAELEEAIREMAKVARVIVARDHESGKKIIADRGKAVGPRKSTGNMRRSIKPYEGRSARDQVRKVGPYLLGTVSAGSAKAPYTDHVHEGSVPHIIRARPGNYLSFWGNNPGTYTISVKRLLTQDEIEMLPRSNAFRGKVSYKAAMAKRASRKGWAPGRQRLKYDDADTTVEDKTFQRAERGVVVKQVNHPGYQGNRFLNKAMSIVMAQRYGMVIPSSLSAGKGGAFIPLAKPE